MKKILIVLLVLLSSLVTIGQIDGFEANTPNSMYGINTKSSKFVYIKEVSSDSLLYIGMFKVNSIPFGMNWKLDRSSAFYGFKIEKYSGMLYLEKSRINYVLSIPKIEITASQYMGPIKIDSKTLTIY